MDPNEAPAVSVADLIQIAADVGIPQDHAPAIADLTIHKDLTFEGWVRTTTGRTRVPPEQGAINWTPGTLELIGVTGFGFPPLTGFGQHPGMLLADVGIVIYRASLKIPNGLAIARSTWRDHGHSSGIDLMPGSWRGEDLTAAGAALRWLENLPRSGGGRPPGRRKGEPWPRQRCLVWWTSWTELDGKPTQKQLSIDMGLSKKDPTAAVQRWRDTGLQWPPTDEQLEELYEEDSR